MTSLLRLRADALDPLEEALRCGEQALARAEPLGMRPEMAHCHRVMSGILRRAGDDGGAREHLQAALALFGELGMPSWAARAEAETSGHRG